MEPTKEKMEILETKSFSVEVNLCIYRTPLAVQK